MSAVAHYVAGAVDRESIARNMNELCASADLQAGERLKPLRDSMPGRIVRESGDGRVTWRRASDVEFTVLPGSLIRAEHK